MEILIIGTPNHHSPPLDGIMEIKSYQLWLFLLRLKWCSDMGSDSVWLCLWNSQLYECSIQLALVIMCNLGLSHHITAYNVGAIQSLELLTLHVGKAESKSLMMVLSESPASPMVHDETLKGHFPCIHLLECRMYFRFCFLCDVR